MTRKHEVEKIRSPRRKPEHGVEKPLVSVITVCRNSGKTIARTIESVMHQTYSRIEYLIIDGASTDETMEIVKRYEGKFKGRMRWKSEKDAGIYDAMNKGIGCAEGKIIGIINSDDWYEPNAIQLVVDSYRAHGDAVYYGILRVIEHDKEVMLTAISPQYLYREVVGHPAYFVAKSLYQEHGLFRLDYKHASDYELMMRFIQRHVPFAQINNILANFHQGGQTSKHGTENLVEYFKIRHKYGYLTTRGMLLRIYKYRILSLLRKINVNV